jgi:hypothetical protein
MNVKSIKELVGETYVHRISTSDRKRAVATSHINGCYT